MLKGLRDEYLQAAGRLGWDEGKITKAVLDRRGSMDMLASQWRSLWQTILRFFFPTLDNVYFTGSRGEVRFNEVYSSEPATYLMDITDHLVRTLFPQDIPWFSLGAYDQRGVEIEKGRLPTAVLRHFDDVVKLMRASLDVGGFYSQARKTVLHDLLLGNCSMRAHPHPGKQGWVVYRDVPIHHLSVQRDSLGQVYCLGWKTAKEKWDALREYGPERYALFKQPMPQGTGEVYRDPLRRDAFGGMGGGVGASWNMGALGTASPITKERNVEVENLMIPNDPGSGIPGGAALFPEFRYVNYVVSVMTKRLIDVEYHRTNPFGVATDIIVAGEDYGRGMCGRVLPDVAVLNAKKKASLYADAMASRPPIVVQGGGFVNDVSESNLKPWQWLHTKQGTTVAPLWDSTKLFKRNRAIFEDEKISVAEGLRKNRIEVEMKDRMSATEFVQRMDNLQGLFAPLARSFVEECVIPVLSSVLDYFYLIGRAPPPPMESLGDGMEYRIQVRNSFTYGHGSEVGANLTRALVPLEAAIAAQPEILDYVDFRVALRSSLARYEMAHTIKDEDAVRRERMERAERMAAGPAGQPSPSQKGAGAATAERAERDARAEGTDSEMDYGGS